MMRKPVYYAVVASAIFSISNSSANAAGDAAAGEQVFKKVCATCHSNEAGVNKTGPSLFGVYGRKAGSTDFPRYKGLVGADFSWDAALLDQYLQDPAARTSSLAVPSRAERLADLPPTLIVTMEIDPNRDEAEMYAEQLAAAGVATRTVRIPGLVHAALNMSAYVPRSAEILQEVVPFLTAHLASDGVEE